jgi:integrase
MKPRPDAVPLPDITFLTQDEVRRLFAVITGKRDRALFQLAYHHGLRASEVSLLGYPCKAGQCRIGQVL